jgi:predicted hydrolase (HD superfamily)
MKKPVLKMFNQVDKLYKETQDILKILREDLRPLATEIHIGKITIDKLSSLRSNLYAVGILSSQIAAAKLMGEDKEVDSLKEMLDKLIKMRKSTKECNEWERYLNELHVQKDNLYRLLSDEEKASLIEIPEPPSGFTLPKCFNKKKK